MSEVALDYTAIRSAFDEQPLFEDKTWQISPAAWPLSDLEVKQLERIGQACYEYYQALERLYVRAVEGRNLLRNRDLRAPWVASYLDRGKPEGFIEYQREERLRGQIPRVFRPDLLITEEGFALTEFDSVPGGIGLTAFLNRLYQPAHDSMIGADDRMVTAFYEAVAALTPDKTLPLIAIAVSDEAGTYRPEMNWLAATLQRQGKRVYCVHPRELIPLGETLNVAVDGNPEQVDIVYRFFELFDLASRPAAEAVMTVWEEGNVEVTPPMRPFQEEKLGMALFHHHLLEDFWKENLSRPAFRTLREIIPKTWIMDPVDLPPNAVLDAPPVGGKPIWHWEQLGEASQKERNLIIKISGFHETAWGARSVVFGSDVSSIEWMAAIRQALQLADENLHLLQEYRKPVRRKHPLYVGPKKELKEVDGRVRLTPYYFVIGDEVELGGVLSTFCPPDKKIIHGMSDAAMLPSRATV